MRRRCWRSSGRDQRTDRGSAPTLEPLRQRSRNPPDRPSKILESTRLSRSPVGVPQTDAFGAARLGGVTGRQLRVNPEPDREEKPRVDEKAGDFPVYEGRATARLNGTK